MNGCRRRRTCTAAFVLVMPAVLSTVTSCKEVEEAAPEVHQPAAVQEVAGLDVKRVRFDEQGAKQVGLRTARVTRVGGVTVAPYAALIYDGQGVPWVYEVIGPLTYQRHEVVVDRVRGGRVWLEQGPPAGAEVVTRGATEVYGAELDIAGGH